MTHLTGRLRLGAEPFGDIGGNAAGILADEFEFLAGDRIAVLLDVKLDRIVHLRGGIGELTGIGNDKPDLDGVLGVACSHRRSGQGDANGAGR